MPRQREVWRTRADVILRAVFLSCPPDQGGQFFLSGNLWASRAVPPVPPRRQRARKSTPGKTSLSAASENCTPSKAPNVPFIQLHSSLNGDRTQRQVLIRLGQFVIFSATGPTRSCAHLERDIAQERGRRRAWPVFNITRRLFRLFTQSRKLRACHILNPFPAP